VSRGVAFAIYIKKSILRQKKNYGNSYISPCKKKKKSSQKNPLKETKILQDSTQAKISSFKDPCVKIDLGAIIP
jgi:hypothetical protein